MDTSKILIWNVRGFSWLKEGDANTKLGRILPYLTSHDEKVACVDHFYTNLIGKCVGRDRVIDLEALGLPTFELLAKRLNEMIYPGQIYATLLYNLVLDRFEGILFTELHRISLYVDDDMVKGGTALWLRE
ncbi:hypothetical protein ACJX0J_030339, partial [Zea mays]